MLFRPASGAIVARSSGVDVADVFSTDLYTGNGSTQTITNNIDLSTEGGMVWVKGRSVAYSSRITDTERTATKILYSNATSAEGTESGITAFNSDGFDLGSAAGQNENLATFVAWSFRKAAGFFDVVTYTGDGVAGLNVSHNLGAVPGMIIVKRRSGGAAAWNIYHRSNTANPETEYLGFNANATADGDWIWDDTAPTDSQFTVGDDLGVNTNTGTHVAYLFGHDATAGGIIDCGSYTGNGSTTGPTVTCGDGWDPQFVMIKNTSNAGNWAMFDTARTIPAGNDPVLLANSSAAEDVGLGADDYLDLTGSGFQLASTNVNVNTNTDEYIYMAIKAES